MARQTIRHQSTEQALDLLLGGLQLSILERANGVGRTGKFS